MLPPLAFGLSNLGLASPWGRERIASRLSQRIGLHARIGGASWSPWHGVTLRKIDISQPPELSSAIADPLLSIASLQLTPVWRSWLHGRFELRAAEFDSPRLVASVEMMSHFVRQVPPPTEQISGPPLAAQLAPPQVALTTPTAPGTPPPEVRTAEAGPPPHAKMASPPPRPTQWLRLRHASLRLVATAATAPLMEIDDLSSDLPVGGDAAPSMLHLASLKAHGKTVIADFHAPLTWRSPVLSLAPVDTSINGLRLVFAGKLAFLDGLPMQLEAHMPKQSPTPLALPGGGVAKAAQVAANGRFRGLLLAPATWQGEWHAEATTISLQLGGHHTVFDSGGCAMVLRGGVLSCVDARCIGEDLSLLGNATLLADGRAAGVIRLVGSPETTVGLVKRLLPKTDPTPSLTPLNTPQRVACDLEVFGTLNDLQIRLGQNGPVVPIP
ncbi:MAG: hypothetical protein WCP45_15560 [Verrucomicrobiota bacterium]